MSKKELIKRVKLAKKRLTKEYRSKGSTDKRIFELTLEIDEMLNRLMKFV